MSFSSSVAIMDITEEFRKFVKTFSGSSYVDKSILKPIKQKSDFERTASKLNKEIRRTLEFAQSHRNKYVTPGLVSQEKRDEIELEIVSFIKTCSTGINNLSKTVTMLQEQRAISKLDLSEQAIAHRHGMVLMLSEQLKELTLLLDKYRSQHAVQLQSMNDRRQRYQKKQEAKLKSTTPIPNGSSDSHVDGVEREYNQQMLEEESQALYEELTQLSTRVQETEKMMQEIATLNQMLSTQIMGQTEQIEMIYSDAVTASLNMTRGNVHLRKAVDLNRSARKYVLVLMILAALVLLFFDRFYS